MNKHQLYLDHERLLHSLARQHIGRLRAVGHSIEHDELFSAFCEVFVKSLNSWDEEKGKLSTYLTMACHNEVKSMLGKYFRGQHAQYTESDLYKEYDEGEEVSVFERLGATEDNILGDYEVMQALKEEAKYLSPFARLLLEYTLNPPEFIERELQAQEAKHELSLDMEQVKTYRRKSLSLGFVVRCLEKTAEGTQARTFIRKAVIEVKAAVMQAAI